MISDRVPGIIFFMPTDTLLLYILPDLAYVAKLIPSKKPHDFVLSDFRQINGSFLDDNILLEENLDKLMAKLDAGSYRLILPDFLFTSTIVNVEKSSEAEVKEYLKDQLLPSLKLNAEDFYLDTTILSNYKGIFKVQLTALEKALLNPLTRTLKSRSDLKVASISPLSWTTKSIISLEPSVAILQLGSHLYLAEHYIGIDQCYFTQVSEASNFAETVKTLKGAEPSLQTVYLMTNSLVDAQLKEELKATLPVQQLADLASENEKMPSYVKQIIEASAKTFSIPEYLLPQFSLDVSYNKALQVSGDDEDVEEAEVPVKPSTSPKIPTHSPVADPDLVENLVKPAVIGVAASALPKPQEISAFALNEAEKSSASPLTNESFDEPETTKQELQQSEQRIDSMKISQETLSQPKQEKTTTQAKIESLTETTIKNDTSIKTENVSSNPTSPMVATVTQTSAPEMTKKESKDDDGIDLSQFANLAIDPSVIGKNPSGAVDQNKGEKMPETKQVLKNQSEAGGIAKMIFIGLLSFVVTIALGVGLGLAYLHFSKTSPVATTSTSVTPTPTASVVATATPTPTPSTSITKKDFKLSVVNATSKSGYAGTIGKKIEDAGFPTVTTGNAKGSYDAKDYLLVKANDATAAALLKEVKTATGLDLELSTKISQEDSAGKFNAVVVLGK